MFAHGGAHGHVLETRDSQSRIQYNRPDNSRHKNSVGQVVGLKSKPGNKDKKRIAQQGKSLSVDSGTKNAVKAKHVASSGKSASVDSGPNNLAQNLQQKGKHAHRRSLDSSTLYTTKGSPNKTERPKTVSPKSSPKNQPLKDQPQPQTTSCFGCLPRAKGSGAPQKPGHVPIGGDSGKNPTVGSGPYAGNAVSPTSITRGMSNVSAEHRQLLTEMRAQNFDVIRFATYRTACKIRFIQKKTNLCLIDIWNMIEAFRENGLNALDPAAELTISRLESLLTSLYCHLNKRLPSHQQIHIEQSVHQLLNWLTYCYDRENRGRIRVMAIKVALATLCAGKLVDKFRYIFTLVSDVHGYLIRFKFDEYLRDVLMLPTVVYEGPSFGYTEVAARSCFDGKSRVNVNDFLDSLISEPGPQCLMWLPIITRMAMVENVFHPIQCEGCHRESFMGFRYKCQRCYNYHMCQDCFWRGRTAGNHSNEHEVKEYTSYQSPTKQIGHSIKKSFRCVPSKAGQKIPYFPETPEKTIDLSNIVPPTPVPIHNGLPDGSFHSMDLCSIDSGGSAGKSPSRLQTSLDCSRVEDEHRLIARYASRLAADSTNVARSPTELNFAMESSKKQREIIQQLESKNRDIMKEIQRLRMEQETHSRHSVEVQRNPTLLNELKSLRQRKDELEGRMGSLQEGRKELMVQLESLMKMLKQNNSPKSTPGSSPRSRASHGHHVIPTPRSANSTPTTPADSMSIPGFGSEMAAAFSQGNSMKNLRNDLLVAADSVTNAMSSLVKELNSEASSDSEEDGGMRRSRDFELECDQVLEAQGTGTGLSEFSNWKDEVEKRIGIEQDMPCKDRKRNGENGDSNGASNADSLIVHAGEPFDPMQTSYTNRTDEESLLTDGESYVRTDDEESYPFRTDDEDAELYDRDPKELFQVLQHRYGTDDESCLETDQESYIRTDDEDGGNTDWEENMKRWVNR